MTEPTTTQSDRPARPGDWRLQIPEERRSHLQAWFWAVAGMTLSVLIVGGITRLTQSGLSIVDWDPFVGVIPPLTDADWQHVFDRYRQYPEYRQLRQGMTLHEFKVIFFWEYFHRLLARAIGLVFLIPFAYFWLRRYFNRPLLLRSLALFGLGAAQGVMGWLMVASGLVDRPSVSHYRLAAHLSLAFVIFGFAVWLARDMAVGRGGREGRGGPEGLGARADRSGAPEATRALMRRGLIAIGIVFGLQVVWGAFVAGLKAGRYHNTFPLMEGRVVPPSLFWLEPAIVNFFQNPVGVQWMHRVLGTVLALVVVVFFTQVARSDDADRHSRRLNITFLALVLVQYLLGVLTLLLFVPVSLAVIHQATAMIMLGVWVWWWHHIREAAPAG